MNQMTVYLIWTNCVAIKPLQLRTHTAAIIQLDDAVASIGNSALRVTASPTVVTNANFQRLIDMLNQNVQKAK